MPFLSMVNCSEFLGAILNRKRTNTDRAQSSSLRKCIVSESNQQTIESYKAFAITTIVVLSYYSIECIALNIYLKICMIQINYQ